MRRRDRINLDLQGSNIKIVNKGTTKYYYYVMPDGNREPLGKDRTKAVEAAHILNLHLRPSGDIAKRILENTGKKRAVVALDSVEKLIKEYRQLVLKKSNNSERTLEEKEYKLALYTTKWGTRSCASIETRDIAQFLNPLSENAYIKHQSLLTDLFGFAIHQGYRDTNPVTVTRTVTAPEKRRTRHTLDGYRTIHAIAPQWLKNAMDIGLLSLQRRADIASLHRDQVNLTTNTIRVLQEKTRNYKDPVYIEIEMGDELRAAIESCLNSNIDCPYLIHTRPYRITRQVRESKPHVFAVTESHITKIFQQCRDKSGAYNHLQPEERPTFHDIRALGIWLYEQAGFPDSYISALSGHATTAMLEHYKAGHEAKKPVQVRADLNIKKKP